ncbi:MAG: hypothetical protein U1F11_11355 [Steroidobacteraceae bacterium]
MSEQNPFRLFVTHAWEDSADYLRVFEFLESARNFFYRSVGRTDQRPAGDIEAHRESLRVQIRQAEIVVAIGSLEAQHRDWLLFEMTFAQAIKKPVILLPGFGGRVNPSKAVRDMASEEVAWDERALVDAIRRLARGEQTGRWDMVEFKLD